METQAAHAAYERLHEKRPWHDGTFTSWSEKPTDSEGTLTHPYRYDMGVTIGVSAEPTDDDPFTTEERARPASAHGTAELVDAAEADQPSTPVGLNTRGEA